MLAVNTVQVMGVDIQVAAAVRIKVVAIETQIPVIITEGIKKASQSTQLGNSAINRQYIVRNHYTAG